MVTKRNNSVSGASTVRIVPIKLQTLQKRNDHQEERSATISKGKHTPEVSMSIQTNAQSNSTGVSRERVFTRVVKKDGLQKRPTKLIIVWLFMLSILVMGNIAGLVWNCLQTVSLQNDLTFTMPDIKISPTKSKIVTPLSISSALSTINLETKSMDSATTTVFREVANKTSIEIVQAKEIVYGGYEFLAVQIALPNDGFSKSENWCREYQYLCGHFSRRPTGCDGRFAGILHHKNCRDAYNSDMSMKNVLGCNPSEAIANITNIAFANKLTPAIAGHNSFGFHVCTLSTCDKELARSQSSLIAINGFIDADELIMYTVCR